MTQPLTAMERRVYDYLLDFTAENTFQPSIREIGKRFRIKSTKTVSDILQALAHKGYIERDASRSRGVRLLGFTGAAHVMPVPYYGRLHGGDEPLVVEHREGFLTVDRRFVPCERCFYVRVGEGLASAGIFGGDLVMVNPEAGEADGDLVAVQVGDEVAVLRRAGRGELSTLHGDGASSALVAAAGPRARVLGAVCGVFRALHDAGAVVDAPLETLAS